MVSKAYNAPFSQATSITAKNWRYWPNIGCYEFSFERTVFFEMTNEATRLSAPKGSQLRKFFTSVTFPISQIQEDMEEYAYLHIVLLV